MRWDEAMFSERTTGRVAVLSATIAVKNLTLLAKDGGSFLLLLLATVCGGVGTQLARRAGPVRRWLGEFVDYGLHGPVTRQILRSIFVKVNNFATWRTAQRNGGGNDNDVWIRVICCCCCWWWGWTGMMMNVATTRAATTTATPASAHHHPAVCLAQNWQLIRIVTIVTLQLGE